MQNSAGRWSTALLTVCVLFSAVPRRADADNWPRFRGENGRGISDEQGFPATWSPGDYAWSIELPGMGHSSPIVWEDRLFITSAVDDGALRFLICLDASTGEEIWRRVTGLNRSHKHAKSSWASTTPTTDGQRVYVSFADAESYLVAAYDFDGRLAWRRDLGAYESQHGLGASPILLGELLVVPNDQDGPSSIVGLDRTTGRTVWSTLRSSRRVSYATPIVLQSDDLPPQLIVSCGAMGVTSVDPHTGRLNWLSGELPARTVASPVLAEGLIIQPCGGGGKGKFLVAIDPGDGTNASEMYVEYTRDRALPYVPTPIAYGEHMFLWNDNGVVSCVAARTGENVWTKRLPSGGNFSGSPVCIDGKLYAISEDGDVVVIAASTEFRYFGATPLGDASHSTPAVAGHRLYLRTFYRLACLEAQP